MIRTKEDLAFFLKEDAKRNDVSLAKPSYWLHLFVKSEHACIFRYISCLRHCEYHYNNSRHFWHKCLYLFYKFRLMRLGMKYNMSIGINVCGYGLRVMHLMSGGVLINAKKVGNYCGFNAGVLIGTNGNEASKPIIGDYVAFGPGAKAFGALTIGNNVFVAANSVVTKDVPDNCIVGGLPARFIKEKPLRSDVK